MGKEKILYEFKEGCYELKGINNKGDTAKVGKNRALKFSNNKYGEKTVRLDSDAGKPILLLKKGFGASLIGLLTGIQPYTLLWKGSYKHNTVIPWGKVVEGRFDSKMYKQMSEEDSMVELLTSKADMMSQLMMVGMGIVIGVFLGMILISQGVITI
jgi:hypothetical protein